MKKMNIKCFIVCLTLITGITGSYNSVFAQDKKEAKKAKKEAEKVMLVANFYAQDTLLRLQEFILETDYLQGRRGQLVSVNPNINFVKVLDTKGTLQTGSVTGIGYNGMGGVTTEGKISNYKVSGNSNSLTHKVSFDLFTNIGTFNIVMNIFANLMTFFKKERKRV